MGNTTGFTCHLVSDIFFSMGVLVMGLDLVIGDIPSKVSRDVSVNFPGRNTKKV